MNSLDEISALEVYDWYMDIERRLTEIVRVLPFFDREGLREIKSPRLASLLLESSSLVDTLLRDQMPEEFQRDGSNKKLSKKNANIQDYRKHLEPNLKLSQSKSLLLQGSPIILSPFDKWVSESDDNYILTWWDSYNSIKHERLSRAKNVTLEDCVMAICALNQVMMKLPETLKLVFRFRWAQTAGFNPQVAIADLLSPTASVFGYVAYTDYFTTFLFPVEYNSVDNIRPINIRNRERLESHLGRMGTKYECQLR